MPTERQRTRRRAPADDRGLFFSKPDSVSGLNGARTLAARAKINWSLDVTGRRQDGYHLLMTVMQPIELADQVIVQLLPNRPGIQLASDDPGLACDASNTAWRAAELFLSAARAADWGVRIELKKRIPSGAGLGGGSADAAAVLKALDQLLPGRIPQGELFDLALSCGADVPFCLQGHAALCQGIGERIEPLPSWPGHPLVLAMPRHALRTASVFAAYDRRKPTIRSLPASMPAAQAFRDRDKSALAKASANDLRAAAFDLVDELSGLARSMEATHPLLVQMTGSGTCLYAWYDDSVQADQAAESLRQQMPQNFIVRTQTT